jgi:hypothetical protein
MLSVLDLTGSENLSGLEEAVKTIRQWTNIFRRYRKQM